MQWKCTEILIMCQKLTLLWCIKFFPTINFFYTFFLNLDSFLAWTENIEYPEYDDLPFILTAKLLWGVNLFLYLFYLSILPQYILRFKLLWGFCLKASKNQVAAFMVHSFCLFYGCINISSFYHMVNEKTKSIHL